MGLLSRGNFNALLGLDPSAVLEEFYGEYDCEWPPLDRYLEAHGH